jgi:transcription antitermination factor NusG
MMDGDMRFEDVQAAKAEGGVVRKWRVIQTNNNAERLAGAQIKALGFEVYLPMAVTERPKTARRPAATIVRPFLPGYLFARFDTRSDDWGSLFTTLGVKAILRGGTAPLSVPDAIIDSIRQREEVGLIKLADPADVVKWKRGDSVKITYPSVDVDAVFEELLDKNRAVVFVSFLGRVTRQVVTPLLLK